MALWYFADGDATFYHIFNYYFTIVGGGMHQVSAIVGSWALISPQSVRENLQTAIRILCRIFSAPELCIAKGIDIMSLRQLSEIPSQICPVMPSSWMFDFLIFRIRGWREKIILGGCLPRVLSTVGFLMCVTLHVQTGIVIVQMCISLSFWKKKEIQPWDFQ